MDILGATPVALISTLLSKTGDGTVKWKMTGGEVEAAIGWYSIVVFKSGRLKIALDKQAITEFCDEALSKDDDQGRIRSLFALAQNSATGAQAAITEILAELRGLQ